MFLHAILTYESKYRYPKPLKCYFNKKKIFKEKPFVTDIVNWHFPSAHIAHCNVEIHL